MSQKAVLAENKANTSLAKAKELLKTDKVEDAIECLSTHLRSSTLTVTGFICLEMLCDLCLTREKIDVGTLIDVLKPARGKLRGAQNIEESLQKMVDIVMSNVRIMCTKTSERVRAMENAPGENDLMLSAVTGTPLATLAERRFTSPCQVAVSRLVRHLCNSRTIGFTKKLVFIYNKMVRQFLTMCKEHSFHRCIVDIARAVSVAINHLIVEPIRLRRDTEFERAQFAQMEKDRSSFMTSAPAIAETVDTLCCILNDISSTRQWEGAFDILSCLKRSCDQLLVNEEVTDVLSGAYETMSDIFWTCNIFNYHAYSLSMAASLKKPQKRALLASRAVIAALCVTQTDHDLDPFGRHEMKSPKIDELFDSPSTTKDSLIDILKVRNVYSLAIPEILKLATSLADRACTDFNSLHKSVSALVNGATELERYEGVLHQIILRHQLLCMSATQNHVDVQTLSAYTGKMTDEVYVSEIEPVILADSSVPVEIDSRTKTITFSHASQTKMLSAFVSVAQGMDVVPAAQPTNKSKRFSNFSEKAPATTVGSSLSVGAEELLAARERSVVIRTLQHECVQSMSQRREDKEKAEVKKREMILDERRAQERKRQQDTKDANERRLMAEYRERQRQERNKAVLRKMRLIYPTLKLEDSLAFLNAGDFEDELTRVLASFKRRAVDNNRKDVLKANLFERALRVVEVPRRREQEAANAEQHRAERAAARENRLLDHRREYDRKVKERESLSKFLSGAEEFESQWRKLAGSGKASKTDEQQQLLEAELRRLAAEN